ncbi:hypothetical protein BD310DRAFT_48715 [Dichomitus squalens]|uniref:Secreted protein n=1 Tax=Dichomitus squalens TaxID=114155 RepID=A0A4Q9Q614_9APHY|nr:hypothetical protein BD310DRAFT_48715 [Dichomitus squalens]
MFTTKLRLLLIAALTADLQPRYSSGHDSRTESDVMLSRHRLTFRPAQLNSTKISKMFALSRHPFLSAQCHGNQRGIASSGSCREGLATLQ